MTEPVFLELDEVLHIHARSLAEHGGSEGVRDIGLIESASAAAKNTFYFGGGDLFDIAASYVFHLAESQAFLDGNKRTGIGTALVFLARNGGYVTPPADPLYDAMIAIAKKRMNKTDLAGIFRRLANSPK